MAARGIRDTRMNPGRLVGRTGIQPARAPHYGRPVMTNQHMIAPASPPHVPVGMPPGIQGPQPVAPQGPGMVAPMNPRTAI